MKILILSDAWHPQKSGFVNTLTYLVDGLVSLGHRVYVIHPGMFINVPCPTYPDIRLAWMPMFPGWKVRRLIDDFAPDCIHLATEGPLGIAGRMYCKKRRFRFTTSFATKFAEYINIRLHVPLSVIYAGLRWFHNGGDGLMVSTKSIRDELASKGFNNLVYWSRGVDFNLFNSHYSFQYDGYKRPIYVYFGRVSREKNLESFLGANVDGSKIIIGDGPDLEMLRRKYGGDEDVHFLGYMRGEHLASHVASADAMVFPSKTDTFGLVMIEAMACGVPVAAYPVTGPTDVVVHGKTGWLDDDLSVSMCKVLGMSPEDCFARAKDFHWERSVRQFVNNLVHKDENENGAD